jgi:hydrogenase nickel incorporation protein HypA/HybF
MHEHVITKNILEIALDHAEKEDANKVLQIKLTIGALSGFEEDCIKMYFEELSKNTIAFGAELIINTVEAQLYCKKCDENFLLEHTDYRCPKCGSLGQYQNDGQDFLVQSIEIE